MFKNRRCGVKGVWPTKYVNLEWGFENCMRVSERRMVRGIQSRRAIQICLLGVLKDRMLRELLKVWVIFAA